MRRRRRYSATQPASLDPAQRGTARAEHDADPARRGNPWLSVASRADSRAPGRLRPLPHHRRSCPSQSVGAAARSACLSHSGSACGSPPPPRAAAAAAMRAAAASSRPCRRRAATCTRVRSDQPQALDRRRPIGDGRPGEGKSAAEAGGLPAQERQAASEPDVDPSVSQQRKIGSFPRAAGRGRTRARLRRATGCSGRRGCRGAPGRAESWPRPRRLVHVAAAPTIPHDSMADLPHDRAAPRRASNERCRTSNGRCRAFATFEEPIERLQLVRVKHPAGGQRPSCRAAARAGAQRTVLLRAATARRCNGQLQRCVRVADAVQIQAAHAVHDAACKPKRATCSVQRIACSVQRSVQRAATSK
jgi:hypothetical protein